ncbi:M48 family metalloprotease [Oceanidesulfovibrio marinus]|uniref:Peptidase M48 n=1 Tax=Oceanidesulfovibrio marinus TaxID=370038 RepID=A0ABX6NH11_9BACT|nr:M48 family metalloprotease [Oceanidesulfovibrio marinus]QJT08890.1 peptidase M48 [Oceanidesulfovibrio marinus]
MKRIAFLLALSVLLLAGCKDTDVLGSMVGSVASVAGVPGSEYAGSVSRSAVAVAKSAEDFTPQQEYYIGRAVGAVLLEKYRVYPDEQTNSYVNLVGQSLALYSDQPRTYGGYRFLILDSNEINAFAAPGGLIFVTRGMLRCCPDEDALAAVLAHEISHVTEKHALRSIKTSRITEAFGVIGSEAAGHFAPAEVSTLTDLLGESVGDIMQTMVVNGYSRAYEREADAGAVRILTKVGYSPDGLTRMLRIMDQRLTPGGSDFAATHPDPQDRIADVAPLMSKTVVPVAPEARKARFELAMQGI